MYRTVGDDPTARVSTDLGAALAKFKYVRHDVVEKLALPRYRLTSVDGTFDIPVKDVWRRKTWNVNDAVVHLGVPDEPDDLGTLALRATIALTELLGSSMFRTLAMLVVWSGSALARRSGELARGVDPEREVRLFPGRVAGAQQLLASLDSQAALLAVSAIDVTAKRVVHHQHGRLTRLRPVAAAIHETLLAAVAG